MRHLWLHKWNKWYSTWGSLWQYNRDESINRLQESESIKSKIKVTENAPNDDNKKLLK